MLIDGTTGDLNLSGGDVARMASAVDLLQNSVGLAGFSVALRWQNTTAADSDEFIRVSGAACTTACTALDTYRIRMNETTYAVPRFNNSGTQVTVLMVSNTAAFGCNAQYNFYDPSGNFLGSNGNVFSIRETHVLNTSTLGFAINQSGSIYISHTCGYGGLAGKAVALEPSTGFAFDTPMTARPR